MQFNFFSLDMMLLNPTRYRFLPFSLAILCWDGQARADVVPPLAAGLETVIIDGPRSANYAIRSLQQNAPNIVSSVSADDMKKLPDINLAESIRRVPGVSLQTDTGEGRYVNLRGIDSDLNSTTFGGLRLPPSNNASPFSGGRAVALDALPTTLAETITVIKSALPEYDAEALGGTIEITPRTMPRSGPNFFNARIGSGYEALRSTGITDLSVLAGARFGGIAIQKGQVEALSDLPFSVVFSASYYKDRRGAEDIEPSFIDDGVNSPLAYSDWDQKHYQFERKRRAVGINLAYQADLDNAYYLHTFTAGYTETGVRNKLNIAPDGAPILTNGTFIDGLTANGFTKTLREEKEIVETKLLMFGGKNALGKQLLDYRVGYVRGRYDKPYDFTSSFSYIPASGTITYDNFGKGNTPRYAISTDVDFLNPANYGLAEMKNLQQSITDKETSAAANLTTPISWIGGEQESLKVGLSGRLRTHVVAGQPTSFSNLPSVPITEVSTGQNLSVYDGQYQIGAGILPNVLQNRFAVNQTTTPDDAINAALQSQHATENVYAAYTQYQFRRDKLQITGGLRVEATRAEYTANAQGVDIDGNTFVVPVSARRNYINFFPSLQMRYDLAPSTLLRAAFSSTIARPGFNQVTPSLSVAPSVNLVTQGNPALRPITANAFDLSLERYLPNTGLISVGLFDKEISDYIANRLTKQSFPKTGLFAGIVGTAKVVSFQNLAKSHVRGLELDYEQHYKSLPGWWNGLGTSINYTLASSRFEIRPDEFSTLPSASKHTANTAIFYERGPLNLRLAGYYVSRNLIAIGSANDKDLFSEKNFSMDFGSSYAIAEKYTIYLNVKNLTNAALKFAEGSSDRTTQREVYGRTVQIGLDVSL